MQINDNKGLLVVIAVVLIGVFAIMLISITQKSEGEQIGESISDVLDSAGDGAKEFQEEVSDEIDDHTTDRN